MKTDPAYSIIILVGLQRKAFSQKFTLRLVSVFFKDISFWFNLKTFLYYIYCLHPHYKSRHLSLEI